jgi:tetratricopeptide (TPR) repeat protein
VERGQLTRAGELFAGCLACSRQSDEPRLVAQALLGLAGIALLQGDLALAEAHYRQVVTLAGRAGQTWELARALKDLALTLRRRGDLREAQEQAERSLYLYRSLGDRQGEARGLLALVDIAYERGDLPEAGTCTDAALAILRQVGDRLRFANVLARRAQIAAAHEDDALAIASCQESVAAARALDQRGVMAGCLEVLAHLARRQGRAASAAQLLGAASVGREQYGVPRHWDAAAAERDAAAVRLGIGDARFTTEWSAGRGLSLEAALALSGAAAPAAGP